MDDLRLNSLYADKHVPPLFHGQQRVNTAWGLGYITGLRWSRDHWRYYIRLDGLEAVLDCEESEINIRGLSL